MPTIRAALLSVTLLAPVALNARPMTPEDVAKLEQVGQIEVSPDGSRVAFNRVHMPDLVAGEDNGAAKQQLKLAYGPDNARAFLPEDISASQIGFSPDGRMVSFVWGKDDEKRAVWGVPVDGGAHRKLAAIEDADVRAYAWAPDGATIHLLAAADKDTMRDKQQKAGFDAVVYEEEARLNRLFTARVPATEDAAIDAAPRAVTIPGYVAAFKIAPNGRMAAVESAPTPNVDDSYTATRLNLVDLATGRVSTVIGTPGKLGDVEWAPDSGTLAMVAAVDANDPAATTLYLASAFDGTFRAVNEGAAEAVIDTEFTPDGRLAAIVHKGAQSVLRIYDFAAVTSREIDPGSLILERIESGGDRIAVVADSPRHPAELFTLDGDTFTRWTSHNPWLAEIDFGNQRTFTYTARDGQSIEGVLIEPVGGVPRGGAPTIMNVHGGPEAHDSNGWQTAYSKPGQVGAGAGYAVFLPNYRGSTAYGTAFSKAHQDDYAGKEFNDIVDGKRALVEAGITDAGRTGITGGSYGGYASAWGATALSEEYAASVMFVGISNQISKFGTTDIPQEMYLVHSRKWPWEDWQGMLDASPIYHVDKARTPILILHGAEDTRVSPSQSYELYRNIKVRQPETPVRLVLYPGEGHGLREAAARLDYNLRMMRWFDTYLRTGDRDAALPAARPVLPAGVAGGADEG